MRSRCAIVLAVVVMGCSGESTGPAPDDSGSAIYPTSDVSGALGDLGAPVADAATPAPEPDAAAADTSIPAGDSAGPSPGVDATFTPDATSTGDVGSPVGVPDADATSPPAPTSDAETPEPAGDIAPAPDLSEPEQEAECLDLLSCTVACEGGDTGCQQACLAEVSPQAAAEAQVLRACRQDNCDGLGGVNGVLCTIGACTCESTSCGVCEAGCEETGAESCADVMSCILDCGLLEADLPFAIGQTCCFTDCHAQGTLAAQAKLDVCIDCIQANCEGTNLIECGKGACATECAACTPDTD